MEKLSHPGRDEPVRPDRRRHPAEPVGAGLPGRPAAALLVHGRPDDQAAGRPEPRRDEDRRGRLRRCSPRRSPPCSAGRCCRTPPSSCSCSRTCSAASGNGRRPPTNCCGQPGTKFVVVSICEADSLREASYFADRLRAERMPLAGLILNRTHPPLADAAAGTGPRSPRPSSTAAHRCAAAVLDIHTERLAVRAAELHMQERFDRVHTDLPVIEVPALPSDAHDLPALREIGRRLTACLRPRGCRIRPDPPGRDHRSHTSPPVPWVGACR